MDWTSIIVSIIGSVTASGGLAGIFLIRENKRAKQLENEGSSSKQWKELYEKSEAKNEALNLKIDDLYKDATRLRDKNNDLTTENAVLKIFKCELIECIKRKPPLGSQTNICNENKPKSPANNQE